MGGRGENGLLGVTLGIYGGEWDAAVDHVEIGFVGEIDVAGGIAGDRLVETYNVIDTEDVTATEREWNGIDGGGG